MLYPLLKKLLFLWDPEWIHGRVLGLLTWLGHRPTLSRWVQARLAVRDPRLVVQCLGLTFPNPVGLAAGLDKNAEALPAWVDLGFGAVELGSVTALAQPGNPTPRLFRLPLDQAIINRMGFNNLGAMAVKQQLERWISLRGRPEIPIGINIGKSKVTPLEQAPEDYCQSMRLLYPLADYFVINVSSPNTPGLRQLQDRDKLEGLLAQLLDLRTTLVKQGQPQRPLLLKIAPDLTTEQLDEIAALVLSLGLDGLIATNTTLSREGLRTPLDEAGGLSGRPLAARSLEVLSHLKSRVGERIPLISVGGVFSAEDVASRLRAGASLVQLYTGFVYGGPATVSHICHGLLRILEQEGLSHISELSKRPPPA